MQDLDIERANSRQCLGTQTRPDIAAQQSFVVFKALGAQPGLRADLEPPIQILIKSLLRRIQIPAAISFAQQGEMRLRISKSAVYGLVQVFRFLDSGSRPLYTRTSQVRTPRRTI